LFCGGSAKVFRGQNERRATRQHCLCHRPSVRHQTATPQHPIRLHPPVPAAAKFGRAFSTKPALVYAIGYPGLALGCAAGGPGSEACVAHGPGHLSRTSSLRRRPCSMTRWKK
jgi:hypothetical protein